MTHQDDIARVFAKYLLETYGGKFIVFENDGPIDPDSQTVTKTKPTYSANDTGKYRDLNDGVYVGELSGTPSTEDSVDIVYKLR